MKEKFEDDGRTIADMSGVERPGLLTFRRREQKIGRPEDGSSDESPREAPPLSKKESRLFTAGAVTAGLVIAAVFILAGAIAIAIMLAVWDRPSL